MSRSVVNEAMQRPSKKFFALSIALTMAAASEIYAQTSSLPDRTICKGAINSERTGWVKDSFYAEEASRRGLTFRACDEMNTSPARDPINSKTWNKENLASAYTSAGILELCYIGSTRDGVSRDEMAGYSEVLRWIEEDAQQRDPELDITLVRVNALRSLNLRDPQQHLCFWARVILSMSYFRRHPNDLQFDDDGAGQPRSEKLRTVLDDSKCHPYEPCITYKLGRLDVAGLLAVRGPVCRATMSRCNKIQERREKNVPIDCSHTADSKQCERDRIGQQERFRKAREGGWAQNVYGDYEKRVGKCRIGLYATGEFSIADGEGCDEALKQEGFFQGEDGKTKTPPNLFKDPSARE